MPAASAIDFVSQPAFAADFGCTVAPLPRNVVLIGRANGAAAWRVAPSAVATDAVFRDRVPATLEFLATHVLPRLPGGPFWFPLCFWDGWRERVPYAAEYRWVAATELDARSEWHGNPGEVPLLSPERPIVLCFGAHRGDPSACLLPDPHYLTTGGYQALFAGLRAQDVDWDRRQARAVYAGGDHGDAVNFFPPPVAGRPHPRRHLRDVVAAAGLPVDVHLGQGVPPAQQVTYRWIVDVDGYTRTWDAWAWKLMSGSVVLSPASPWESFFTRQFEAWEHYVPVANDFSDLGERLEWCRTHDDDCRRIAREARRRAEAVYRPEHVTRTVVRQLKALLDRRGPEIRIGAPGPRPGAGS